MGIDCLWVKCVGGLLFLKEISHHTHAHHPFCYLKPSEQTLNSFCLMTLEEREGLRFIREFLQETLKTRVLQEKCPLCKGREIVYSLFLCQLPNLVIASISLSPWRAANCLWNGLVIPALVTLSGRPPQAFIILQRKMCFLTSVLHLFSFNFL